MSVRDDAVRRVRKRWLAVGGTGLAVVLLAAVAATVMGRQLRSPAQLVANAAPPPLSAVTATVERRVLAEPVMLRGKVQAGAGLKLSPPATAVGSGSVLTKVLAKPGAPIREGQVLLERAGEPLLALMLPFPLYRDITAGAKGPDVTEVQKALKRLGYRVGATGEFDAQTQRAVASLYSDRGYTVPSSAAKPGAAAGAGNPAAPPAAGGQTGVTTPGTPTATPSAAAPVVLPQAHVLVLDRADHKISAVNVHVGDVLTDPKTALFDLDREAPTILALVARDQASLLRAGQAATATDDAVGTETQAEVAAVGTQPTNGADGQTGFEVRLRFTGSPLSADGERSVRLTIQIAAAAAPVLAVPVTAVFSHPDGSTFVTVPRNGTQADVTVTTGQIVGGWVEIRLPSDSPLTEGSQVVVSEQPNGRR